MLKKISWYGLAMAVLISISSSVIAEESSNQNKEVGLKDLGPISSFATEDAEQAEELPEDVQDAIREELQARADNWKVAKEAFCSDRSCDE